MDRITHKFPQKKKKIFIALFSLFWYTLFSSFSAEMAQAIEIVRLLLKDNPVI